VVGFEFGNGAADGRGEAEGRAVHRREGKLKFHRLEERRGSGDSFPRGAGAGGRWALTGVGSGDGNGGD